MKAHILLEPDPALWPGRKVRAQSIIETFKALGYEVLTYGPDEKDINHKIINPSDAENLETQLGILNGYHAVMNEHLMDAMSPQVTQGDLIVATEGWLDLGFRGLLEVERGKFKGATVIEYGIDYLDSFAPVRIFSSRHCLSSTSSDGKPRTNWIFSPMYIPVGEISLFELPIYDEESHPFRLDHLYAAGRGVPTVAPDWGVWAETVANGYTGMLYRTPKGKIKAEEAAIKISAQTVQASITTRYNIKLAAAWCGNFIRGI